MTEPIHVKSDDPGIAAVRGDAAVGGFGIVGISDTGKAIEGRTDTGQAVIGTANNGTAILGTSDGFGVVGISGAGKAIEGRTDTGHAVIGTASSGTGVLGTSETFGVVGISGAGKAVEGRTDIGNAVVGTAGSGTAILGTATSGTAVRGISDSGEGVHGDSNSGLAAVAGVNTKNGPGVWAIGGTSGGEGVHAESRSGAAAVAGYGKGAGPAGWFEGNVVVKGNVDVSGDLILDGADYAEALPTTDPDVVAGSVVVLGHDGELHPCEKAYDPAVAGIVSGARGVKPALVLDRQAHSAPVALMGKVWCFADAHDAPIRPGDLLTTAATRGHCRRVTDCTVAFGAVVGKALTSLQSGRGLVRVLVSPR